MAKIEIYINDSLVDLPEGGVRFSATYSVADIASITQRKSSLTKTLTLPGTARNRAIFGFAEELSSTTGIDQTVKPNARIDKEGVTVLKGVFKITNVVMSDTNNIAEYKGVILGDNGSWKLLIQDLKLSDLDLSDQDHTYNTATINTSETLIDTRDYVYPLINYGEWIDGGDVSVEDRFPAVRVKRLFEQIFNDQGYILSSAFFDSDFGKKLFMPFTNKTINHPVTFADDKLFRANKVSSEFLGGGSPFNTNGITFIDDFSTGFFDQGGHYNGNNNYTFPVDMKANFIVDLNYSISDFGSELQLNWQKRTPTQSNYHTFDIINIKRVGGVSESNRYETGFLNFNAGDKVRIAFNLVPETTATSAAIIDTDSVFSIDISRELTPGGAVVMADTLPDMFQIEFMQGIKTLFNLYFDTDVETRTVTVEPFDDFYTGDLVDWSEKLDLLNQRQLKYIGADKTRSIIFDYSQDSNDAPVEQIIDRDDTFAEHEDVSTNAFAKDGESTVAPFFSATLMDTASTIGFTDSLIPKLWNDMPMNELPDKSTDFNTRILYYAGITANVTDEEWIFEGTTRTDYPRMIFYDEVNDNDENLMFKTLRRSHGLFEKYYRNSQKILNEGRIFIGFFNLNDNDISNLNFRSKYKLTLNGEFHTFRLNKVQNYNGEGLTKVELITDVGTQKLTQVTTEADDPNVLPPAFQPTPDSVTTGIVATVGGIVVPVYSTEPSTGNVFWVQSSPSQQGGNGR